MSQPSNALTLSNSRRIGDGVFRTIVEMAYEMEYAEVMKECVRLASDPARVTEWIEGNLTNTLTPLPEWIAYMKERVKGSRLNREMYETDDNKFFQGINWLTVGNVNMENDNAKMYLYTNIIKTDYGFQKVMVFESMYHNKSVMFDTMRPTMITLVDDTTRLWNQMNARLARDYEAEIQRIRETGVISDLMSDAVDYFMDKTNYKKPRMTQEKMKNEILKWGGRIQM